MDSGEGRQTRGKRKAMDLKMESRSAGDFFADGFDSGEGTQTRGKREAMDLEQESLSAGDFFADNKKMAGFDNPGESLYNTVRVLVENALDSAESIRQLPSVEITIEEIPKSSLSSMTGSLETGKASQEKALGKKVKAPKGMKGGFYRVTCKDNGRGMTRDDIPKMFERGLCGTNDRAKQTRGESGLGTKMAFLWAKMSTGQPVEISTSMKNQNCTTFCRMDVDILTNVPHIHLLEEQDHREKWHGAELKVVIEGDWRKYGLKISEYMRQIAVITPYAEFKYRFVADTRGKKKVEKMFPRRTKVMPQKTKWLASVVNIDMMKHLVAQAPKEKTLLQFIQDEFAIMLPDARRLIEKMGPLVTHKTKVKSLCCDQLDLMQSLFHHGEFDDLSHPNCLSPVGADKLRLGIIGQLQPEFVATHSTRGRMHGGHPFILEVGLSLEGDLEEGITVFRFANRVPLPFEEKEEADVVTRVVKGFDWKHYKINRKLVAVGVFVSIVSTKIPIPFKGTGVDQELIAFLVKVGLEHCCLELKDQLNRNLESAATSVFNMLEMLSKHSEVKITDKLTAKYVKKVSTGEITLESFKKKSRLSS